MNLLREEHNELYAPWPVNVHETRTPRLIFVLRGVTVRKNLQSVGPKVRNVGYYSRDFYTFALAVLVESPPTNKHSTHHTRWVLCCLFNLS
jgi:hypothetical protein